jgi:tetratricopeptide (TPR) repeat protein
VALDPRNTQALNNLAWLYSTSADDRLRDPNRALMLARQAVQLEPESAHMLDTLAEAHYVNGNRQEAIRVSRRALAAAEDGREYYRRQLERFLQAHTGSTEAAGASEQPPAHGGPS